MLPVKPFTSRPIVPFKDEFGVGVHRATEALKAARAPHANWTLVTCPWQPNKAMHCAYYGLWHETESILDEQRLLPPTANGWLPPRQPGQRTTLLWSLDHATRTAPIGIWTLKELPTDCTLQSHHPASCIVVSAHIGSEKKRDLKHWHDMLPFFDLIEQYRSLNGPLGPNHRNILCCDAIAFQKLFEYSPANAYTNSPTKQCCIFCDRSHQEVREWNVDTSLEDVRLTDLPQRTPFSWLDCVPDYLLHGNRNLWYRVLKGGFQFLTETGCFAQVRELLTALQQVDADLTSGDPEISWQTAESLLKFDFSSVAITETDTTYTVHMGETRIDCDEAGLVIQLCQAWQDIFRIINVTRAPTSADLTAIEQGCRLIRECIALMIPHGFNPTIWVHVIAYHLPQHLYRFGNLRQFGLWGQEAKHREYRRKYHCGPLVGAEALAYGMDLQRVEYKVDNDNLDVLQRFLTPIPRTLEELHESGEVVLSDG